MWLSLDNVCARVPSGNDCKDKKNRFPCSPDNYLEDTLEYSTQCVVAAGTGATPAAFYLGLCRLRGILSLPAPHDYAAGGLFSAAATKVGIVRGRSSQLRPLQADHSLLSLRKLESDAEDRHRYGRSRRYYSPLSQRRIESDAEGRCDDGRSRRAILHRHYNYAAAIRKSGLEIKNRCTLAGVNREKLASIRKSKPEIKNRCTQEGVNGENRASIPKSGLEIKNRRSQEGLNREIFASIPKSASRGFDSGGRAGADAPGGGISLCFCRRGCAAPAQKAATLNDHCRRGQSMERTVRSLPETVK